MSDVHVSPEQLRDFAAKLTTFTAHVDERLSLMQSQVARLGTTWQDPGFGAFQESFYKTKAMLASFVEECKSTVPSLNRDADAAEAYLRIKP
jgi:uncharacterized protein YukE